MLNSIQMRNHGTWGDCFIEPDRWVYKQWRKADLDPRKADISWFEAIARITTIVLLSIATLLTFLPSMLGLGLKTLEGFISKYTCLCKTNYLKGLSDK